VAAASRLHLTRSAISQQIAILERELGIPVVERLSRGVGLTAIGKVLAERGQSQLREVASLEQELRRRKQFPGAQLIPHASQPEDLEAELAEGLIDVGLTWDCDFLARPMGALYRQHCSTRLPAFAGWRAILGRLRPVGRGRDDFLQGNVGEPQTFRICRLERRARLSNLVADPAHRVFEWRRMVGRVEGGH
jgi:Bacterial regulatory helix-turn-helix protein, lysR family